MVVFVMMIVAVAVAVAMAVVVVCYAFIPSYFRTLCTLSPAHAVFSFLHGRILLSGNCMWPPVELSLSPR